MPASKKILAGTILVLVASVIALFIIVQSIDLEAFKPKIATEVARLTGRTFEINGPVELDPGFNTRLRFNKLELGNAINGTKPRFATVETVEAEVELLPLLGNELVIRNLLLKDVKVWLEVDQQGQANWQFQSSRPSTETESTTAVKTTVSSVQINNTSIFYQKHGQPMQQFSIDSLAANMDEASKILHLDSSLQINNKPLQLMVVIDPVEQLLADNNAMITAKGGYAGKPFNFSTNLTLSDSQVKLDDVQLELNGEALSGAVDYRYSSEKPIINADISFDRLDLDVFKSASTTEQDKTGTLFSSEVFELSWINDNNLDIELAGKQLVYNNWQLNTILVQAVTDKGKLVVTPAFGMGEGEVKGVISMDASAQSPLLDINISGNGILPGKISTQAQQDWIQQSKTTFNIKATASGNSPAQLAANLNGRLFVDIGKGSIRNEHLDLVGGDLINELFSSLNPAATKDDYTQVQCAVVNLRFKKGVARYDKDIAAMTDKMVIISAGEINLENETLDIGFSPQPRKDSAGVGINAGELVSVAKLTGRLADPELGLDAANTAKVGVKAYGAIATGGISLLLDGLVSKMIADEDPCQTARGGNSTKKSRKTTEKRSSGLKSLFGF